MGWAGFRIALPGFVIPFTFIYAPALLFVNSTVVQILIAAGTAFVGVVAAATALQGYLLAPINMAVRVLLFVGSCCLIFPGIQTDVVGLGIILGILALQKYRPQMFNA